MTEDIEQIRQSRDQTLAELNKALETLGQVRSDLSEAQAEIERLRAALGVAEKALRNIETDCDADYPLSHGAIKYATRSVFAAIRSAQESRAEEKDKE